MRDMKALLKNPNLYYVAAPVVGALFTLVTALILYPGAVAQWQDSESEFKDVREKAEKLLNLQPERLAFKINEANTAENFDFAVVINDFAKAFEISPSNYTTSVKGEVKRQGKRARSATVSIKSIDIEKACTFLSTMLAYWPDLECDVLSLDKGKAGKDDWKADMTLTYFY